MWGRNVKHTCMTKAIRSKQRKMLSPGQRIFIIQYAENVHTKVMNLPPIWRIRNGNTLQEQHPEMAF